MKVIGIGGFARCGKDAFVSIAKNILLKNGYQPQRVAFADNLKSEVDNMLEQNNFELDVYNTDNAAKSKIRPLLVWWGCARRDLSDGGLYWVDQVNKQLTQQCKQEPTDNVVTLISDVRFPNEAQWLHKNWDGEFIHIRRFSYEDVRDGYGDFVSSKTYDAAPNEEEAKNDPLIREIADVHMEWESKGIPAGEDPTKDEYLQRKVLDALNSTKFFKHTTTGTLSL